MKDKRTLKGVVPVCGAQAVEAHARRGAAAEEQREKEKLPNSADQGNRSAAFGLFVVTLAGGRK
jgi:hypothetical protein